MYSATEAIPLWEKTEVARAANRISRRRSGRFRGPAGRGSRATCSTIRKLVRGRDVLDLAAGGGLVAIAAALAGARRVTANEIDPLADAAIALNAARQRRHGRPAAGRSAGRRAAMPADVVLAGDVFYSRADGRPDARVHAALPGAATVLVGDPGRAYAPVVGADVTEVAGYDVPVIRDLEDLDVKRVRVLRIG